jgi:myo-inositol-1(or 4)-monophosphatase
MLQKIYKTSKNREILEILLKISKEVADFQKANFRTEMKTSEKTSFRDLVTEIDIKSQQKLEKNILKESLKIGLKDYEIGFFGEENENRNIQKYTFIIDPIDGTLNFATGFPYFSISIGVMIEGEISIGLVYHSLRDEVYIAIKDEGSYKLDLIKQTFEKLEMKPKPLNQSIISGNFMLLKNIPNDFLKNILGVRSLPGLSLQACYVAENLTQANFSKGPKIWDIAASMVIINEAGGIILDFKGNKLDFNFKDPLQSYPCIVCHSDSYQQFSNICEKFLKLV